MMNQEQEQNEGKGAAAAAVNGMKREKKICGN